jgi:hypothetical protein
MKTKNSRIVFLLMSFLFAISLVGLTACGGGGGGGGGAGGITLSGTVMGGTSPVSSSKVNLYQAGTSSGGSALPLESTISNTDGTFAFTYTVPSTGSYLYYVEALGGNPGTGTNGQIDLLSVVGPTGSQNSNIIVNEMTTIATVHAFYNLMGSSTPGQISASSFSPLQSAWTTFAAMVDPSKGTVLSTNTDNNLSSHANLLAICVESSNDCSTEESELGLTASSSDLANIAYGLHTASTSSLFQLSNLLSSPPISLPFSSTNSTPLVTAGSHFSVFNFSPSTLAFDASGNIWLMNGNTLEKFSSGNLSTSAATFCGSNCTYNGAYNFNGSKSIAIDGNGNIWVANSSGNSVTEIPIANPGSPVSFCSSGCTHTSNAYQFNGPSSISIDGNNNVWVTNSTGNSVTEIPANNSSSPVTFCASGCSYAFGNSSLNMTSPGKMVIDGNNNVWILYSGSTSSSSTSTQSCGTSTTTTTSIFSVIAELQASNHSQTSTYCQSNNCTYNIGIGNVINLAIDPSNNIWIANGPSSNPTSTTTYSSPYTCATLGSSQGIGSGSGLLGSSTGSSSGSTAPSTNMVTEIPIKNPSSPLTFCASGCTNNGPYNLSGTEALVSDAIGNIWVVTFNGDITEIPVSNPSSPITYCSSGCTNDASYGFNEPDGVYVDSSGNLWVLNQASSATCTEGPNGPTIAGCTIPIYGPTILVSLATPTKTPLIGIPQKP